MIGNVVQTLYLTNNDYPQASAISLILMVGLIIGVILYTRVLRGQELTV
jgi:spermidine/putrescine transport system permease protein